ncbi:Pre-mRNA-splicing factor ISY1, partial [Paramicrosporidium saccamoebae]
MARNEEKAQSMLYRFRKAMQNEQEGWLNPTPNEPLLPTTCTSLPAALHARKELLKDISRKLSRIHDSTLEHPAIRALNDDLNRQIRKTHEWEERLRELGHTERDKTTKWGEDVLPEPGNVHGYLYFGRAKELPGVAELLNPKKEAATKLPPRILEMQRVADSEYFGIDSLEREEMRQKDERAVEEKLCITEESMSDWLTGLPVMLPPIGQLPQAVRIDVPTQTQVEQHLIERRRRELLR